MESADIWYELGQTCSAMGLLDKAAESYLHAIEHNMRSGWLYNNLAEIHVQKENYLAALSLYQKSLDEFENPKDLAAVWGRIGNVYTRLNEYGKAIQAFQKADEINPCKNLDTISITDPESNLGLNNGGENKPIVQKSSDKLVDETQPQPSSDVEVDEGVSAELEDGNQKKDSPEVWNDLGLILFKVGAYDDAIDAYENAIALSPTTGYLYSNLGQVFAVQGKLSEAVREYEKSLRLMSNNRDKSVSWTRLGDLYRQLDKNDCAQPAYMMAEVLNETVTIYSNEYKQVKIEAISTSTDPIRGLNEMSDLVQSIHNFGIIQPLIVCPGRNEPGKYQLISGRRRLEAARQAGLKEVPVIVRRASIEEIQAISINENIHHVAVTPFELAQFYSKLANEFELSIEEISARVGRSVHSVANSMKMLEAVRVRALQTENPVQLTGQNVIDRSLADLKAAGANSSSFMPNGALEFEISGDEPDLNIQSTEGKANDEAESSLWYLEPAKKNDLPAQDEGIHTGSASLLNRARQVLNSNPQSNRLWVDSSYRA